MANALTGGFDVVAEFSLGAVNRVLAAMHRGGRLQHSLSMRVDNTPRSRGTFPVTGVFGEAMTSRMAVARTNLGVSPTGAASSSTPLARLLTQVLDPLVNVGGIYIPPPVANPLHGVAQLQLGAATISLPATASNQATVHIPVMAQYFPDQNTTPLQRFLSGEIQITFAATEVSSAAGKFIHVDLAQHGAITFQPAQPLDQDSVATINSALRGAMATAFQPSNTPVPSSLTGLRIFTLPQSGSVAVLMNLPGGQPPPSQAQSFNSAFLHASDQFAIAVSADFLGPAIAAAINTALDPYRHIHIKHDTDLWLGTITVYVDVTIDQATLQFQDGSVLLTVIAHVQVSGDLGSHHDNVTLRQAFTLNLNYGQVTLALQGDLQVDNSSTLFSLLDWLSGAITDRVRTAFASAWNNHQPDIQSQVAGKLNSTMLQGFLKQLMNPVSQQTPPPEEVDPTLAFTSIEMRKAGVVLHGTLAVPPWPAPDVEFDLIPNTATMQHPEYNALNSWIPGGTIQNYVWGYLGTATPPISGQFVSINAPALGYAASARPFCLTVHGTRISPSGPVAMQAVTGGACHGLSVFQALAAPSPGVGNPSSGNPVGSPPDVGLAHADAQGNLQIVGHTSPWVSRSAAKGGTVNLLVHFPNDKSLVHLDVLNRSLEASGRKDADTAILCVLGAGQIAKVKSNDRLAFADDHQGWESWLQVRERPATILLGPSGKALWRHDGDVSSQDLTEALKKNLSAQSYFTPRLLRLPLKVGLRAPNFVFEYSAGRELTLRKLTGRRVVLLFLKRSSKPSMDTLATLQKAFAQARAQAPILLAIDASDSSSRATKAASDHASVVLVPDPNRQISAAYGISVWPTTIVLDAQGTIRDIHYGLVTEAEVKSSAVHS